MRDSSRSPDNATGSDYYTHPNRLATDGGKPTHGDITVREAAHGRESHQRDLGEHPGNLLVRYPSNTDPDSYTMTERDADHDGLVERYITAHKSDYVVIRR